ncbi:unnamed protein product [Calicophoron daubneyi]|uniref:Granulins domain-containing protein n=1 Tax=Calicophoron daubneyi TaxID=300641 RepID=A0AAV2TMM7_CALDB
MFWGLFMLVCVTLPPAQPSVVWSVCPPKCDGKSCGEISPKETICCPYVNGVCCGDGLSCCPRGSTCDLGERICRQVNGENATMKPLEISAVCCEGGKECCPSGTKCDAEAHRCLHSSAAALHSIQSTLVQAQEDSDITSVRAIVLCPDKETKCPDKNTCCETKGKNSYGCCPLPKVSCIMR